MNNMGGIFHSASSIDGQPAIMNLIQMNSRTKQPKLEKLVQNSVEKAMQPAEDIFNGKSFEMTPSQKTVIGPLETVINFFVKIAKRIHK